MAPGLRTDRRALKAIVAYAQASKTITKPVDAEALLWTEAP